MKRLFILYILTLSIAACKKEDTADVSKTVNVSYPSIALKGPSADTLVWIAVGGSYSEAGATLTDDITGAQSDISPESQDIDLNTPGVYYVTYRASNANGFETEKSRVIVVYDPAIPTADYTGTYSHDNGRIVDVTQLAPRLFMCDDLYGTWIVPIPAYFVDFGDSLYAPVQPIDASLGFIMWGAGSIIGSPGSYVLDFSGLIRDGFERPRTLTQQ